MSRKHLLVLPLLLGFILSCYKDYIALWEEGADEPRQIFPYKVAALPPEDQQLLEKGIRVKTVRELSDLLEDYLS